MSDDEFFPEFEDGYMEIQIKTLLGTTFEFKVSSTDTIADVKRKVYRFGGPPIYQQTLIFHSHELKDTTQLSDAGIKNGSILTLVSAMRGGPISTRRLSVACEHHVMLKELKELLENTRDDITPGSKVSVLVFKEGDVINLLRVIENEDGSYSPYSEKPISPPTKPARKECRTGIFERLVEDNEMSTKLTDLRKRMDELNIRRQSLGKKNVEKENREKLPVVGALKKETGRDRLLIGGAFKKDSKERLLIGGASTKETRERLLVGGTSSKDSRERLFIGGASSKDSRERLLLGGTTSKESRDRLLVESSSRERLLVGGSSRERVLIGGASSSNSSSNNQNSSSGTVAYKLLSQCGNDLLDNVDLKIYEKSFDEENEEEIALKEKHRSKFHKLQQTNSKSLYSESKGAYSHTRQTYARIHKKSRDLSAPKDETEDQTPEKLSPRTDITKNLAEQIAVLKDDDFKESLSLPMANRIHLTRLVLSETSERPKSSPDSIELEENAQDLWEIHEPASERLKHSATCKVGLMKRRTSHDYGYEGRDNTQTANSNLEVCSASNFYQFGPPQPDLCDYYFTNSQRSPLYGRTTTEKPSSGDETGQTEIKNSVLTECSRIQRLKNDDSQCDSLFSVHESSVDELYGYYNLGCTAADTIQVAIEPLQHQAIHTTLMKQELMIHPAKHLGKVHVYRIICKLLSETPDRKPTHIEKKPSSTLNNLPPVIKKKSRCSECNKRLNITNIYDCRCGKIFCSQHRYSEVHRCTYDYKLEGKKMLKQQNPLVTAEKVAKI